MQQTTGDSRKEQTLTSHCALSVPTASHASTIRCSSGREAAASLNICNTHEKYNEWEAQLSMQVKLAPEHVKSVNRCAVEVCGAKWRHTCAQKLHETSDQDDGAAISVSVSRCFLCAHNAGTGERIERLYGTGSMGLHRNRHDHAGRDSRRRVIWHTKETGVWASLCVNNCSRCRSSASGRRWANDGVPMRVVRWTPV